MARCRSNSQPYPIYTTVLTGQNLPPCLRYRPKISQHLYDMLITKTKPETPPGTLKQKLIQTMFRDSETQTYPYRVDISPDCNPGLEILTLGWLSYNNGLPAGLNEIVAIERARQKRAWESALPLPFDETTTQIRKLVMEAIETNEWNYREELIAVMTSLRAELARNSLKDKCLENKMKYEERLSKYTIAKKKEKLEKMQKIKKHFNRELRKLNFIQQKFSRKYKRSDIIKQFTDKTSELYAPLLRFGEDPRHWHEKLATNCGYWQTYRKLEVLHYTSNDVPDILLPAFDFKAKSLPKQNTNQICIRVTRWTEQNLGKLHEELKNIRKRRYVVPRPCYLKRRVAVRSDELEIPRVEHIPDEEEDVFQASIFLQKTIKGRAIQAVMFEGRVKCQELIEELKSTHALQTNIEDMREGMRKKVYDLQRQAEINELHERKKDEILRALEGKTVGSMLDFLSKELVRLQNERMTHALALLADQERHKREAAEAGRRQLEEQRRREHDEMFKQLVKINQNFAFVILEESFAEHNKWLAHREAREYITEVAKKIDQTAKQTLMISSYTSPNYKKDEEIVADLIHNFALPEAEKQIVRKRMQVKQRNYLKICHDEVYSYIEKIVEGARTSSGMLISLPKTGKQKIPPTLRVKYRRLKRMHDSSSSSLESVSEASTQQGLPDTQPDQHEPPVPDMQEKEILTSQAHSSKHNIIDKDNFDSPDNSFIK